MQPLMAELTWSFGVPQARGGDSRSAGPSGSDLLGLGLTLALAVLIPLAAGAGVDALLHISPIGLLVGLAVGVAIAAVTAVQRYRRALT
jgi:F0F1-type ATP synthase assembly protein I